MPREPKTADVAAEMVANVLSVSVAAGDRVAVGDAVVLLESMKMEIPVLAEHAGTVAAVKEVTKEGDASGLGAVAGGVLGGMSGEIVERQEK